MEEKRNHWETYSKYKVSLDLCGKSDCKLCEGHPPAGLWGKPGSLSPAVGILPFPYPDRSRPGHYLQVDQAVVEHVIALAQKRKPPKAHEKEKRMNKFHESR